jgi:hypothetical protein
MRFYGGEMTDNFYDPEKNYNPWSVEKSFDDWLLLGIQNGWVSKPVCSVHDGIPSTREEDLDWEDGGDPCVYAVRLFSSEEERLAVIENMGPHYG